MARPIKKGLDYFPHDCDMGTDEKIEMLETEFGIIGYALYNKILEKVYRMDGDFSLESETNLKLYARKWGVKPKFLKDALDYMRKIELFPETGFFSNGVISRLEMIKKERERNRLKYTKKQTNEEFQGGETPVKPRLNSGESTQSKSKSKSKEESKIEIKVKPGSGETGEHYVSSTSTFLQENLYLPDFEKADEVKHSISKFFDNYTNLKPETATISRIYNALFKANFEKNIAFRLIRETFHEYKDFDRDKQNMKYLCSRIDGKINDYPGLQREKNARNDKNSLKKGLENIEAAMNNEAEDLSNVL